MSGTKQLSSQVLFWGFEPEFHGREQAFRINLIRALPYFWTKIAEEIEVVTGNTDHVERQSKTKADELNARFDSV